MSAPTNPTHGTPSEAVFGPRPDATDPKLVAARTVNAAWRAGESLREARRPRSRIEALEVRCERLEAAVYSLTQRLLIAEDDAAYAVERSEAA